MLVDGYVAGSLSMTAYGLGLGGPVTAVGDDEPSSGPGDFPEPIVVPPEDTNA